MDIKNRLNTWAKQNDGSAEIHSTITLKSKDMNIFVSGDTLEEAYNKLYAICLSSDDKEPKSEEKQETKQTQTNEPVVQQLNFNEVAKPQNAVQPQSQVVAPPGDLQSILKGRQLLKMYNPTVPLNPGESIQRIGNIDYVVKEIEGK